MICENARRTALSGDLRKDPAGPRQRRVSLHEHQGRSHHDHSRSPTERKCLQHSHRGGHDIPAALFILRGDAVQEVRRREERAAGRVPRAAGLGARRLGWGRAAGLQSAAAFAFRALATSPRFLDMQRARDGLWVELGVFRGTSMNLITAFAGGGATCCGMAAAAAAAEAEAAAVVSRAAGAAMSERLTPAHAKSKHGFSDLLSLKHGKSMPTDVI